jgi:hypothetical protein
MISMYRNSHRLKVRYLCAPLTVPGLGTVRRALEGVEPRFDTLRAAEKEAERLASACNVEVTLIHHRSNRPLLIYRNNGHGGFETSLPPLRTQLRYACA